MRRGNRRGKDGTSYFHNSPRISRDRVSPQICPTTTRKPTQKARYLPEGFQGHPESGKSVSSTSDPVMGRHGHGPGTMELRPHTV